MKVHYSSKTGEWETPQNFFDSLDKEFRFTLDAAATGKNSKCRKYYTKQDDGLSQSWAGERVFCNPPYGREIGRWVEKLSLGESHVSVGLLPARTDTRWFHSFILKKKAEIRFLKGRLKFKSPGKKAGNAPFPSMVVVWKGHT